MALDRGRWHHLVEQLLLTATFVSVTVRAGW